MVPISGLGGSRRRNRGGTNGRIKRYRQAGIIREFRTEYYHCETLIGDLATVRKEDYVKYKKKLRSISRLDLLILDDFLLHPITDDYEVKALYDVLESRNEAGTSCLICSQRDPKSWPTMLMEDEVSYNSILKRVTKNYNVMINRKSVE